MGTLYGLYGKHTKNLHKRVVQKTAGMAPNRQTGMAPNQQKRPHFWGPEILWWAMRDSNPQPCACKAPALTVAPIARRTGVYRISHWCRVLFMAMCLLQPSPTARLPLLNRFFLAVLLGRPAALCPLFATVQAIYVTPPPCGQATSGPGDGTRCNRSHITYGLFVTLIVPGSCPGFDRPLEKHSAKAIGTDAQSDRHRCPKRSAPNCHPRTGQRIGQL